MFTSSVLDINFVLSFIEMYTLVYFCAADIKLSLVGYVCVTVYVGIGEVSFVLPLFLIISSFT